jgi:hypothetical protein
MPKMKTCRSCCTEIDARATHCPHCRQKQPRSSGLGIAVLIFAAIVVVGGKMTGNTPASLPATAASSSTKTEEKKPPPPKPLPGEKVTEEYFRHLTYEVGYECSQAVKRLIKYDIRSPGVMWGTNTGEWAFLRWDRWTGKVSSGNTVAMAGDEAEAQNGFGNWIRINYTCTIDLSTMKALHATVDNGRFTD